MVIVNGLQLPASFVAFFKEHWCSSWDLKEQLDADGNPLEAGFTPLDAVERLEEDTVALARNFGVADKWSPDLVQSQTRELPSGHRRSRTASVARLPLDAVTLAA